MILQRIYHQLQEWIIMLDSPELKETDAGMVQEEMKQLCGKIWMNRDSEKDDKTNQKEGKNETRKTK